MGDALAVALLKARGFTAEDFALSHPGGALGRKLYCALTILCIRATDPACNQNASLRDALIEITRKISA